MNTILMTILLWLSLAPVVLAHPEYVKPTGASGCTACHNDNYGNGFKAGVLAAAYSSDGLIEGLKDYIDDYNDAQEDENTNPVLSPINEQWDVTVGEAPLLIPLRVYDDEHDDFVIHGSSPSGYSWSKIYLDSLTELPSVDYRWSPKAGQANKTYTVSFYAQEKGSGRSLKSNTVTATVRVWSARTSATKQVSQFRLQTAQWSANKLTLSGVVIFKTSVTSAQRAAALTALTMTLVSNSGKVISAPTKLTPIANGAWQKTLGLTRGQVPCSIRLNYEGLNASRLVKQAPSTCIK